MSSGGSSSRRRPRNKNFFESYFFFDEKKFIFSRCIAEIWDEASRDDNCESTTTEALKTEEEEGEEEEGDKGGEWAVTPADAGVDPGDTGAGDADREDPGESWKNSFETSGIAELTYRQKNADFNSHENSQLLLK